MKIADVLFVVFLVLKLAGLIDWSWWWVFSPMWGAVAWAFIMYVFYVAAGGDTATFLRAFTKEKR